VIEAYGQRIAAVSQFKYLGITLDECGSVHAHVHVRAESVLRAFGMFFIGLHRIPSYSHAFACYLWQALVVPVVVYGLEVFSWSNGDITELTSAQLCAFRRLLGVGRRAPSDCVDVLMGCDDFSVICRSQRLALFLRLLNSPPASWQHVALLTHYQLHTKWFQQATQDLRQVLPTVFLRVGVDTRGAPFLFSTGSWSVDVFWLGAQPPEFPTDILGQRHCPDFIDDELRSKLARHIRQFASQLRLQLRRESGYALLMRVGLASTSNDNSKFTLLMRKLCSPGPPLDVALGWISRMQNRSALSSLVCGDWALAKHAANYYAPSLLPHSSQHIALTTAAGVEPRRVCLHCWVHDRIAVLDDEAHCCMDCPLTMQARTRLFAELSVTTSQELIATPLSANKLTVLLSSQTPSDWEAIGRFVGRVRQARRKQRRAHATMNVQKLVWVSRGHSVCRQRNLLPWCCWTAMHVHD